MRGKPTLARGATRGRERTVARGEIEATTGDGATRERLLASATRLFAEDGFERVSVRDIVTEAQANVAAVNYHFAGKQGLYQAVIDSAIAAMRKANDTACNAPAGSNAEQKLRHYVHTFIAGATLSGDFSWIQSLMRNEMENPTPAFRAFGKKVLAPRYEYLTGVVGELLGVPAEHDRAKLCALSIHAQCVFVHNLSRLKSRLNSAGLSDTGIADLGDLESIADHVVQFCIGGIAALGVEQRSRKRKEKYV